MSIFSDIIYEDDFMLVCHKQAGISVNDAAPFFLVHRLDQRVSGLMVLAKDKEVAATLSEAFKNGLVEKKYRAVVANKPPLDEGQLIHWLQKDNRNKKSKVTTEERKGFKKSLLSFRLEASSDRYYLLNIQLQTGRFHQIRAQLAFIKCPIVGDLKYGYPRSSPDGSIFLQSYFLAFEHPVTKLPLQFELPIPEVWKRFGF